MTFTAIVNNMVGTQMMNTLHDPKLEGHISVVHSILTMAEVVTIRFREQRLIGWRMEIIFQLTKDGKMSFNPDHVSPPYFNASRGDILTLQYDDHIPRSVARFLVTEYTDKFICDSAHEKAELVSRYGQAV